MSDKLLELGIPAIEITPAVSIAANGLLEHIEQLNRSLVQTYDQLEKLQNLIDTDTNPALPNKKSFLKRLTWTTLMGKRTEQPSCCVVLRIKDFEKFSLEYGFQASNSAINHIARTLSNNIRDTDFFARIGEHDFAVIMFFADLQNAQTKAQKLCHNVATNQLQWNGSFIGFECDFGVHQITTSDTADNALLAANNSLFANLQKPKIGNIDLKS